MAVSADELATLGAKRDPDWFRTKKIMGIILLFVLGSSRGILTLDDAKARSSVTAGVIEAVSISGLCKARVLKKRRMFVFNISSVPTPWPAAAVKRGERAIFCNYWALKGS